MSHSGQWLKVVTMAAVSMAVMFVVGLIDPRIAMAADEPAAKPRQIVFMIGEVEYDTAHTLPAFAAAELEPRGFKCTIVQVNPQDPNDFPGLEALREADLLFVSVRRRSIKKEQMQLIRDFLAAGKPLVGIRTASHAFGRDATDENHESWWSFDRDILGAQYEGHWNNKIQAGDPPTIVEVAPGAEDDPIIKGVKVAGIEFTSHLYKYRDMAETTHVLLAGHVKGADNIEPVAWTNLHEKSRVFYTSLGDSTDLQLKPVRTLLVNAICWTLGMDTPGNLVHPDLLAKPVIEKPAEQ